MGLRLLPGTVPTAGPWPLPGWVSPGIEEAVRPRLSSQAEHVLMVTQRPNRPASGAEEDGHTG